MGLIKGNLKMEGVTAADHMNGSSIASQGGSSGRSSPSGRLGHLCHGWEEGWLGWDTDGRDKSKVMQGREREKKKYEIMKNVKAQYQCPQNLSSTIYIYIYFQTRIHLHTYRGVQNAHAFHI